MQTFMTPVDRDIVNKNIEALGLPNFGDASIREIVQLVSALEAETGIKYARMEMGIPGLPAAQVGINAEIEALQNGVASRYPMIDGIPALKEEASRFIKLFMNIDLDARGCVPTVGSMQGGYATFLTALAMDEKRDTALFIDPGFPVQKQQMMVMGQKYQSFDVYNYRGDALRHKLISYLEKGNINSIIYSNPNNPAWICFTEEELKIIGELANEYNVIVIEDLAYFAMDFREDLSEPGCGPYQPTVANYTSNYVLMISSSKIFSYAGQRIGIVAISNSLYDTHTPYLEERLRVRGFGNALIQRVLYSLSSGTSHSAQYALAAMFKAVNNGEFKFLEEVKEYGNRAQRMKKLFLENGFELVYATDLDKELADGFYFTISYPGLTGGELLKELLYYGVSAISLKNTGSNEEGLRACVSHVMPTQFELLEKNLQQFHADHPIR